MQLQKNGYDDYYYDDDDDDDDNDDGDDDERHHNRKGNLTFAVEGGDDADGDADSCSEDGDIRVDNILLVFAIPAAAVSTAFSAVTGIDVSMVLHRGRKLARLA